MSRPNAVNPAACPHGFSELKSIAMQLYNGTCECEGHRHGRLFKPVNEADAGHHDGRWELNEWVCSHRHPSHAEAEECARRKWTEHHG